MGIAPLLGQAEFDSRKFTWLGSITDDDTTCVTWNSSPIKTWDDFLTKPSKLGGLGADADPDIWALLYKNVFGAKVQLVSGYPGTNDVVLAMDPAAISARPATTMMCEASTAPVSPAARAKGTVRPSAIPMTMSRTTSDDWKCFSV